MDAHVVADTDIIIDFFRGRPEAAKIRDLLITGAVAVTAVTLFELFCGAQEPEQRADIERLAQAVPVLPVDARAADTAAAMYRELRRLGRLIAVSDLLIAGCCMAHGLPLLTHNVADFGRIPGLALAS